MKCISIARKSSSICSLLCILTSSVYAQSTDWTQEKWVKSPSWLVETSARISAANDISIHEVVKLRDLLKANIEKSGEGVHRYAFEWIVAEYFIYRRLPEKSSHRNVIACLKYADSCGGFLAEEYAYWRFLLEGMVRRTSQAADVGIRLTESRPTDLRIFMETINTIKHARSNAQHEKALQFFEIGKMHFGNDYRYHGALGDYYYHRLRYGPTPQTSQRESFRLKGIEHLTKYVASPELKAPYRSVFERRLRELKEKQ